MKRIISGLITIVVLVGVTFIVSIITNTTFFDFSFGVGLVMSVIIWFYTSKGGFTSTFTDETMQIQSTNWKIKKEKHTFNPNIAFYTAVFYTLISIVCTFIYYKEYLIN